jgi:hypothetical protein
MKGCRVGLLRRNLGAKGVDLVIELIGKSRLSDPTER